MALHHACSGEVVRLRSRNGTAALAKTSSFEAIHLSISVGDTIPAHNVAGAMTLYCISGDVTIELENRQVKMGTGDWLYLDPGVDHALRGDVESTLLLTILFNHRAQATPHRGEA